MALITIRHRAAAAELAVPIATVAAAQVVGYSMLGLGNAVAAQLVWRQFAAEPIRPDVALGLYLDHEDLLALATIVGPVFLILGLRFAPFVRPCLGHFVGARSTLAAPQPGLQMAQDRSC